MILKRGYISATTFFEFPIYGQSKFKVAEHFIKVVFPIENTQEMPIIANGNENGNINGDINCNINGDVDKVF